MIPNNIIAAAKASQAKYHVPASVSLAQWMLESNSGKAMPAGSNNPFGIKAVPGQASVDSWTHETLHGQYVKVIQKFAKFPSIASAFDAHAHLLSTSKYYVKAQHATNPDAFAMALQGIYATGIPGHPYGPALISLMKANNLYQYDQV